MTSDSHSPMALDTEQEALWYLSGQRIIHAPGERLTRVFCLTEYVIGNF